MAERGGDRRASGSGEGELEAAVTVSQMRRGGRAAQRCGPTAAAAASQRLVQIAG
ncbi:hypothetical protein Syun_023798 [Stephania yunnanensis]|uniref:Uncharacterized protein n=1 Tax=Stephania yunnanensis TaxID=152371 RepID=A0AAP0I2H6_9MAGN